VSHNKRNPIHFREFADATTPVAALLLAEKGQKQI